jgi:2-keto-3-deoxy-L-rhamnonate aldolase RhmA
MIDLSSRLASGDTLYGTFLGLGSALAAEACALAGFDWLLTDLVSCAGNPL